MKKVIKSRIFIIIVLCIISCGIGVYAAVTYNATDVLYTSSDGTSMTVNDALNDLYENNNKEYYVNGWAAYYNPVSGEKCKVSEAVSTTGTKTGCMKWYIYKVDGNNYTMILDHNTTAVGVQWSENDTVYQYEKSLVKPEVDKLVSESKWVDTPRLISAEEIAQITGNTSFVSTGSCGWFCFDTKNACNPGSCEKSQGTINYAWLFDYTGNCTSYGCNFEDNTSYSGYNIFGYWTSTTAFTGICDYNCSLWCVSSGELVECRPSDYDTGIRPVITIPKSRLS